ncbi:Gfo/Idh/MocA family protein [Microvirga thermotolerans]|uniref:Gfo/Idh/MocA family oxidoreductase n=1 Tax=Microvirga thermotolerans TaxID=2651334 RepID=A0A5P9JWY7_9HYPH|nr:Gfo/Idh/MocA family oxidoreductase [Microvirga thermotolerans]QFU16641.1 gfo/Idh/MocA family oxidoreductase [Microvirga thermotolerans]
MVYRIGIIGFGKIAQDQHLPAIRSNPNFELTAVASQRGLTPDEARHTFTDYRTMLREVPELDAVAICTPPQVRHVIARDALEAGKHVLLEKPPAATLSELEDLRRISGEMRKVAFTTWHAQYNRGVDVARDTLAGRRVSRLLVTWKEDVRHWHPGQQWIWQAGGFGVFDPGINALSIVTKIMPVPVFIRKADLLFPANRDAPIAADITFSTGAENADLRGVFDWRQTGPQTWDIEIDCEGGPRLKLSHGGSRLEIDGSLVVEEAPEEYPGIYRRFETLLDERRPEIDDAPLRLVADAFTIGRRVPVEPFEDEPGKAS